MKYLINQFQNYCSLNIQLLCTIITLTLNSLPFFLWFDHKIQQLTKKKSFSWLQRTPPTFNKTFTKSFMLIILITHSHQQLAIDTVITFYLQKYPYFKEQKDNQQTLEKFSKKVQQPGYLSGKIIKSHKRSSGVPGIMCMYAGHVVLSDQRGQVIFPRLQNSSEINFLLAKALKPAYIVAPATIYKWQIDPSHPAKKYRCQLKQNEETQLYYFETTEIPLPKDNSISEDTIIIISDPENIFVPQGATITDYSPNLTLPNIYIKKEFCFVYNSFYTLSIKQYFRQSQSTFQQEGLTVSMIQQPNA